MDIATAEQVAAVIGDIHRVENWIYDLDMQDTARSRNIAGFMPDIYGGFSEETATEIRNILRHDLVSQLVRLRQDLTKFGVKN